LLFRRNAITISPKCHRLIAEMPSTYRRNVIAYTPTSLSDIAEAWGCKQLYGVFVPITIIFFLRIVFKSHVLFVIYFP
jgi:hypothetical protein